MEILNEDIRKIIDDAQLCFVATVNDDQSPSLSPKASLAVFDDHHVIFANIASPQTVANLIKRPTVEINVVDIFKRRGYGLSGKAEIFHSGSKEYDFVAQPLWANHGSQYPVHHAVKVKIEKIRSFHSPAYQYGENVHEESLVEHFLNVYSERAKSD